MEIASIIGLACFITACFLTALTGAWFRPGEWYERLKKPSWRPPNRLFAPMWTILYVMIAVAGWLIWREAGFAGAGLPLAMHSQCCVDTALLRPAPPRSRLRRHRSGLGVHHRDHRAFLSDPRRSRVAARALPSMGYVRHCPEFRRFASEFGGVAAGKERKGPFEA